MLNFVNIENEITFQSRISIPDVNFGLQIALKNAPLDFEYPATESVSTFVAVNIDSLGNEVETISLSTSLIVADGVTHSCDGSTDYSEDLDCGSYYFLVNGKYHSETFTIIPAIVQGSLGNTPISVSGLEFYDSTYQVPYRDRKGHPDLTFGIQYSENSNLLPFKYVSSEAITSFDLIELDVLGNEVSTTSLSTSLISSDGSYHYSTGNAYNFSCGIYFLRVNDKYESEIFASIELENSYLLLEIGDYLLLETGYKLLLE